MTTKSGIISKIIYKNESNGYAVCAFETDGIEETIVGYFGSVHEGTSLSIEGDYAEHVKYGRQFKVSKYQYTKPKSLNDIQLFFIFNKFDGIGPILSNRIIDAFGDETIDIIENNPYKLLEVKGISKSIIDSMVDTLSKRTSEQSEEEEQIKKILEFDISLANATKIFRTYKERSSYIIMNEPYKMALDIDGFGFKTCDDIAMKAGFSVEDERRVIAAIEYIVMQYQNATGNCYINKNEIPIHLGTLLGIKETSNIDELLSKLQMDRKIVIVEDKIYLRNTYIAEKDSSIILYEMRDNIKIITGGPGTGKTTKVKQITNACIREGGTPKLCAPTGRAAKRIKEQTGFEAQTIHRLLGYSRDEELNKFSFAYNSENKLECDLVIVDEASMLDLFLLYALLKAVPENTKIYFVGDVDQLPSVGCGQVLKDMISSKLFDTEYLTVVHRQDKGSKIVVNAHKIRNGEYVDLSEKNDEFIFDESESEEEVLVKIKKYITEYLPKRYENISRNDIQIICPSKIGLCGTAELNLKLQDFLNPPMEGKNEIVNDKRVIRQDDKVMQIKNNYDIKWEEIDGDGFVLDSGYGLFNGDTGIVKSVNNFQSGMIVSFDRCEVQYPINLLKDLEHAYAITVHKSQGSEYKVVIIPIFDMPRQLATKKLLYTAITRARELVIIIGSKQKFYEMCAKDDESERNSRLCSESYLP